MGKGKFVSGVACIVRCWPACWSVDKHIHTSCSDCVLSVANACLGLPGEWCCPSFSNLRDFNQLAGGCGVALRPRNIVGCFGVLRHITVTDCKRWWSNVGFRFAATHMRVTQRMFADHLRVTGAWLATLWTAPSNTPATNFPFLITRPMAVTCWPDSSKLLDQQDPYVLLLIVLF